MKVYLIINKRTGHVYGAYATLEIAEREQALRDRPEPNGLRPDPSYIERHTVGAL